MEDLRRGLGDEKVQKDGRNIGRTAAALTAMIATKISRMPQRAMTRTEVPGIAVSETRRMHAPNTNIPEDRRMKTPIRFMRGILKVQSNGTGILKSKTSVKAFMQDREIKTDEEAVHAGGGGGCTCHRLLRGRQIRVIAKVMPVKPATHRKVVM